MLSRIFVFLIYLGLVLLTSCQVKSPRNQDVSSQAEATSAASHIDPKYSISNDRQKLDELRKQLPANIKIENDEEALTAELFEGDKYSPEVVREKFEKIYRKKRDKFNEDLAKERELFNKNERKKREDFLKNLEEERSDFLNKKSDRDERTRFFNDQDEQRKTFFAEQKEKREEFESNIKEKRKNHEDYFKEKLDEFNARLKSYRLRWNELKKQNQ